MTIHIWKTIICNWCTGRKEIYSSRFKKLVKKDGYTVYTEKSEVKEKTVDDVLAKLSEEDKEIVRKALK